MNHIIHESQGKRTLAGDISRATEYVKQWNENLSPITKVGALACVIAAGGSIMTSAHAERAPEGAYIVCTGEQVIPSVGKGQTLEGLIEANVSTDPAQHLKSDANLNRIARAIPVNGVDGKPLFVYKNTDRPAPELIAGEDVTLPETCELD